MSNRSRSMMGLTSALGMFAALAGCEKHSHVVVHSYEYNEQTGAQPNAVAQPTEQPPSEYKMVSPGEMASPGEMSSPGRMVVEPRRTP